MTRSKYFFLAVVVVGLGIIAGCQYSDQVQASGGNPIPGCPPFCAAP